MSVDYSTLTPKDLAALLGVDAADAGLLACGPVRLPAAWVAEWKARTGPVELSLAECALVTGLSKPLMKKWVLAATLAARRAGGRWHVAPAALVETLRRENVGKTPTVAETPGQRRRRATAARDAALAVCAKPREPRAKAAR